MFDEQGRLVVSLVQEGLVRVNLPGAGHRES
jgi:acyl-CoA thioesterase